MIIITDRQRQIMSIVLSALQKGETLNQTQIYQEIIKTDNLVYGGIRKLFKRMAQKGYIEQRKSGNEKKILATTLGMSKFRILP